MNKSLSCLCMALGLLLFSSGADASNTISITAGPVPSVSVTQGSSIQSEPISPPSSLPVSAPVKADKKPMIAIVIDDMGVDMKRSAQALDLPSAVTMSYLPYSRKITEQVKAAKDKGHEIILHMPMQAENPKEDPGPHHLTVAMTPAQLEENIAASLDAFTGYDGVNNHEGSKFTTYKPGLDIFMADLEKRHVFFLDSRTSPQTVAEQVAKEHHLTATHRDVFLDDVETAGAVVGSLDRVEAVARKTGSVIAIGHPKDVTLPALKTWLATLEAKGFQIVPLSSVVEYRNQVCVVMAQHIDNK